MMRDRTACVALGSNLGEPVATLHRAAGRMHGILPGVRLAARSRVWHTAPLALGRMEYPRPEVLRHGADALTAWAGTGPEGERAGWRSVLAGSPPTAAPPWYANMAVRLECAPGVTPEALFEALMRLEAALGRDRVLEARFGPRVIDIDLLLFGNEARRSPRLTLPHPRMWQRAFVALPLAEVAPDFVPPEIAQGLSFSGSGIMLG